MKRDGRLRGMGTGACMQFRYGSQKSHGRDNIQGILPGSACGKCPGYSRSGGGYLGTALGCDIVDQKQHFMGHYNHLDTINAINTYESIPAFIENEGIRSGIIYNCVKNDVPFVLNGSIRDDGPLPEVSRGQPCGTGHDTIPHTQKRL